MTPNEHVFTGFQQELEKQSADLATGLQGLALGAAIGAAISGIGTKVLEKLIQRNRDLAVITGAIMGAGALGGAGFILGKGKKKSPPVKDPRLIKPPTPSGRNAYVVR